MRTSLPFALLFAPLFACGGQDETGPMDDFPSPPPIESGEIELITTEQMIPAGADIQICHFLNTLDEEMYISAFNSYQGKFGHHFILFSAVITEPEGTVRDCSSSEDMIRFRPIVSNERFGVSRFQTGAGLRVPKGIQMVLQQHYVNTTERPLRVKDVARILPIKKEDVTTPMGFMGLSNIEFRLPPGKSDVIINCHTPFDMNLLVIGPHMHEWGRSFTFEIGRDAAAMETAIDVPSWDVQMRDAPKIRHYEVGDPAAHLPAGTFLRTSCHFDNTTPNMLGFPNEMCATFGYFYPAPLGDEQYICSGEEG